MNVLRPVKFLLALTLVLLLFIWGCDDGLFNATNNKRIFSTKGIHLLPSIRKTNYKNSPLINNDTGTALSDKNKGTTINWNKIDPLLEKIQEKTYNRYVGLYSVSDLSEETYYYATSQLSFSPEAVKRANGEIKHYFFESTNNQQEPTQLFVAYIPDSKLAEKEMLQWILSKTADDQTVFKTSEQLSINNKSINLVAMGCAKIFEADTRYIFYDEDGNTLWIVVVGHYEISCGGMSTDPGDGGDKPGIPDVPCADQLLPIGSCGGCHDGRPPYQHCQEPGGGGGSNVPPCESTNPPDYCTFVEPCDISSEQLKNTFPEAPESTLEKIAGLINEHAAEFGVDTEEEMRHFLAQAGAESGDWKGDSFSSFEENLNYRVKRLGENDYWENYFNTVENPTEDPKKANPYDYERFTGSTYVDPVKFANYVYNDANRPPSYKLGNTDPGDGYKYRGRGIFQLTGKYNYSQFNTFYRNNYNNTVNLLQNPDSLANNKEIAVISALWFFRENVLGEDGKLDGNTSVETVTEKVNGGNEGLHNRKVLFNETKTYINCL